MAETPRADEHELVGSSVDHQSTTADLVRTLASDTAALVRQEIELARAELSRKAKDAGTGVGGLGAAGVLALFAVGTLTAAAVAALALTVPTWAAALVVAAVQLTAAGTLAAMGSRRLKRSTPPVPEQTVETVKEDVEWARTQMRSARR